MHQPVSFSCDDIDDALQLWKSTEHLGIGHSDALPDLERFLDKNAEFSFVIRADSKLIGTVLAGHDSRRGYIYHLATSGSKRREGVASALLDASVSALKDAGIRKCHAFVFRSNPYAELFWSKMGWLEREDLYVFSKTLIQGDA